MRSWTSAKYTAEAHAPRGAIGGGGATGGNGAAGGGGTIGGDGGAVEMVNASMYTAAPRRVPKWKASGWIGTPGVLWKVNVAFVHGTVPRGRWT